LVPRNENERALIEEFTAWLKKEPSSGKKGNVVK